MKRKKTIILGVTGSIAAYKACEIVSRLTNEYSYNVKVIMTEAAMKFISPLTFESISGNQVISSMFDSPEQWDMAHISLAREADIILVTPATANIIGKIASGIADDMMTTTIMATEKPVIFAPAMNKTMWENPIVQGNIQKLKKLGYYFIEPEYGVLACGEEGKGRLANLEKIIKEVNKILKIRTKK